MSTIDGWDEETFTAEGYTRTVFRRGVGPGVVVIHEIPGVTPRVIAFAEEVVAAGFTVVMPSLVGEPGRPFSPRYAMTSMAKACIAKEFTTWATGRTSPIVTWLRALAADLHDRCGGPGVGAVGMCLTGGFALGMMVDDRLIAPVLSQPSLPLAVPKLPRWRTRGADLNLSPEDLARVEERAAAGCPVLGLRYDGDALVGTRFETLRRELGDAFIAVELPSSSPRDHSVLTEHRHDPTVVQVLEFFRDRLMPG